MRAALESADDERVAGHARREAVGERRCEGTPGRRPEGAAAAYPEERVVRELGAKRIDRIGERRALRQRLAIEAALSEAHVAPAAVPPDLQLADATPALACDRRRP